MKRIIANGQILDRGQLVKRDILIENGRVAKIAEDISTDGVDEVIDAKGNFVSAGLIDVHVHYRQPGQEQKETVKTGSLAAAHGGFTTVCAMPNVTPAPDSVNNMEALIKLNHTDGAVHIKQYAAITTNRGGDELVDFKALKDAGAFAFSNDGNGIQKSSTMYEAMQQAAKLDMAIVEHVQDDALTYGGVLNGGAAKRLGMKEMPWVSETAQVARDVILAEATGVHYHVCHASSKHTVNVIRAAKQAGINVTAEVSPHHLLLSDANIKEDNAMYKMNPPLRGEDDRQALIEGLLDGTIDMIATDHAPHTKADKDQSIATAAFGITGSETAFSMLYTRFVKTGRFTLAQLVNWLTKQPASVFKMRGAGSLAVGQPADIAIFDLKHEHEIKESDYLSKGKNSPFTGEAVYGDTVMTLVDGDIAYKRS
ncbi:dihydroorotase [Lentilactobacillus buchneri]|uniref:Dihydroorotase n=1 Tax=Lentilactobacillus buchneri subsp. silagei CD034 TaxID=1071400 RepID=J9W337_LENBU|nr:dihydroorotase [Lentilactobacillus buchneri]MCC6100900.1 dihydroorotase [Lactobacillus sp.]AFR99414.1 dihydroorotase [Lentilactobacillus buchneri subsp. silagei CD034]MCT2900844.1 dihydroorotase [Lentilactobacillus buchneri]MCT3542281.1 dihydroorotase [Lentilactobacillus buchneri]MCT3546110.1 dihydroorotase [Lentilactobacillus buchneri]